jgi:hypothetical protein
LLFEQNFKANDQKKEEKKNNPFVVFKQGVSKSHPLFFMFF